MLGSIFSSGCSSGCARVTYEDITPSTKCNYTYMLIQLKSIEGMGAFEIREWVEKCFEDLDKIKQDTRK